MAATIEVKGTCDHKFSVVKEAFAEGLLKRGEVGASVAVDVDGHTVVDLWGGHADEARTRPWERNTIVNVYSATKGATAICAHRLAEGGLLDLDAPVASYWPEFAQGGKESLPVRYLLSHRAGLPAVRKLLPLGAYRHWEVMTTALAGQEPWWEPGTKHGYHALTFGWLVGEVVRRISGKSLGSFFRDEIAGPLGLDFHIGLNAKHDARVAEIIATPPAEGGDAGAAPHLSPDTESMAYKAMSNPEDMMVPATANTREWRGAEVPAANGHANARSLARMYGALARGGELDGVHILSEETIQGARAEQSNGMDAILGNPRRFGLGFMLPNSTLYLGPGPLVFGHSGAGGALGFADPDTGIGFGYAMNQMQGRGDEGDLRWRPLIDAVYGSLSPGIPGP